MSTDPRPPRRWLIPVAFVLFATALMPVWSTVHGRDAWRIVYFEPSDGTSELHTAPPLEEWMVPHVFVDTSGDLQVPEGRTVALPLRGTFSIDQEGGGLPLVGLAFDGDNRLDAVWTPAQGGGEPFDPDRPWRQEQRRLDALTDSCGAADALVVEAGPPAQLRYGDCTWSHDGANSLVVLGADRWKQIRRTSKPFSRTRGLHAKSLGPSLGLAALAALGLAVGLGSGAAASTGGTAAAVGLLAPHLGVLAVVLAALLGLLSALARATRHLAGRVAGAALLLLGVAAASPPGQTLLVGYSTVVGYGIRPDAEQPDGLLQANCPALGPVDRLGQAGGTIDWLSAELCSGAAPTDGVVVMLGGTNDDMIWGLRQGGAGGKAALLLAGLRASLAPSDWTAENVDAFYRLSAERTGGRMEGQTEAYTDAVACTVAAGSRFLLAQNFLVTDLREGRGEPRSEIVQKRFDAVVAAGGEPVDLFATLGDEAAVSWFADYIHLSAVGHTQADRAICEAVSAP